MRDLTESELNLLELARKIVNGFAELPESHPADMEEIVGFIHGIQNIILARPATESVFVKEEEDDETPLQVVQL